MTEAAGGQKRVLFVVDKSGFGGIQTIAYTLMAQSFPAEVGMWYFFLRNLNDRFGMEESKNENVFYSRSRGRYSLTSFIELHRLIRAKKIDILHLNGNKAILFGALMKRFFFPKLKIVAHEHGGVFDYSPWYLRCVGLLSRWVDLFISLSNYRRNVLVSSCGVDGSKIRVLRNFVDPARVADADAGSEPTRAERLREKGPFVIGYLGGLSRIKGCDVLLRAIPLLKPQLDDFRVVIAGAGPAREELEQLAAELGLQDRVSFLGYVDRPAPVYRSFDLMVIPSRSEAGPMALYEAWTVGLPVVSSDAPVLNEIIADGETGILFRSEDSADLAEKILRAYRDRDLVAKIKQGSSREVAQHTVDRYLVDLQELYASL